MRFTRRRMAVAGIALACLVLAGAGLSYFVLGSHRAPSPFGLSASPAIASADALAGSWKVAAGSQVGYRAREQFINQPAPTEAVARTSKVAGTMRIAVVGSSYRVSSIDFTADLSSLVSQDKYATFQTYQRDFFVRRIYLETDVYPKAEFKSDGIDVPTNIAPGPATLQATGRLTVHGVTKPVTTSPQAQLSGANLEVVGSISVDMRDYNVEPPDISFTKAEAGVVIEYRLILSRV
jgi:polyisoprenoid-binding protein YceI